MTRAPFSGLEYANHDIIFGKKENNCVVQKLANFKKSKVELTVFFATDNEAIHGNMDVTLPMFPKKKGERKNPESF